MERQTQVGRAQALRSLHDHKRIVLLPNAWDAGSARLFARRGFATLALGAVDQAARAILDTSSFDALASEFTYADAQRLFES